jgi:hypothetical protein
VHFLGVRKARGNIKILDRDQIFYGDHLLDLIVEIFFQEGTPSLTKAFSAESIPHARAHCKASGEKREKIAQKYKRFIFYHFWCIFSLF